jgi:hypothetical protein
MAISQSTVQMISQMLGALPGFIQATQEVMDLIANTKAILDSGQDPTPAQWDEQNRRIEKLREELHRP